MRPKSMATVVVVLLPSGGRSSMPSPASVIQAPVLRGGTSETEETKGVLPTPNPPAITIFAEMVRFSDGKLLESIQVPFQHRTVVAVGVRGGVDGHRALGGQV